MEPSLLFCRRIQINRKQSDIAIEDNLGLVACFIRFLERIGLVGALAAGIDRSPKRSNDIRVVGEDDIS